MGRPRKIIKLRKRENLHSNTDKGGVNILIRILAKTQEQARACTRNIITRAQPKAGTGHKMQSISVSQSSQSIFSTLHCEGYIADFRYRWLITSGGARWLIEILSAILKSMRTVAFTSPALMMHKFMDKNLRVNIWRANFTSDFLGVSLPIGKLIESKTHICVTWTSFLAYPAVNIRLLT